VMTEALLKEAEAAAQANEPKAEKATHFKAKYSSYSGLGVTAIYFTITSHLTSACPRVCRYLKA
jgi:hypothetical protein